MSIKPTHSHRGPGYSFSGSRAAALKARTRYLEKHGSAWLFAGERPPAPGWPAMPKAEAGSWSRQHDSVRSSYLKTAIAEHMAEGGLLKSAAISLGISKSYASKIWREIVAELGAQAI